jgi:hypothetical protein
MAPQLSVNFPTSPQSAGGQEMPPNDAVLLKKDKYQE